MINLLQENKKKGILGEKIAIDDYQKNGYSVISTRFGSDFVAYKKIGVKLYQEYVEVKTGRARQSVAQRKKMKIIKRMGIKYSIYRITEEFLRNYSDSLVDKASSNPCKNEKIYSVAGDP